MTQRSTPAVAPGKRRTGKPRRTSSPIAGAERTQLRKNVVALHPPTGARNTLAPFLPAQGFDAPHQLRPDGRATTDANTTTGDTDA